MSTIHRMAGLYKRIGRLAQRYSIDGGTDELDDNTVTLAKLVQIGSRGHAIMSQGGSADAAYVSTYGGELVESGSMSGATVSWTTNYDTSLWDGFQLILRNVTVDTANAYMFGRVSRDNGVGFDAGTGYDYTAHLATDASVANSRGAVNQSLIALTSLNGAEDIGVHSNARLNMLLHIFSGSAEHWQCEWTVWYEDETGTPRMMRIDGAALFNGAAGDVDAFQVGLSAGAFNGGNYALYGVRFT